MDEFTPEELEVARLPERPGIYWAKKLRAADWQRVEVTEIGGRLRARPPHYESELEAFLSQVHRSDYYLIEIYEWNRSLEEAPRKPDIGPMGDSWPRRKRQRAVLRELARATRRSGKDGLAIERLH